MIDVFTIVTTVLSCVHTLERHLIQLVTYKKHSERTGYIRFLPRMHFTVILNVWSNIVSNNVQHIDSSYKAHI